MDIRHIRISNVTIVVTGMLIQYNHVVFYRYKNRRVGCKRMTEHENLTSLDNINAFLVEYSYD